MSTSVRTVCVGGWITLFVLLGGPGAVEAQPVITAVSSTSGTPGTTVRLYGANLTSNGASPTVRFGSTPAPVEQASASVLEVTVPEGEGTGTTAIQVSHLGGDARAPEQFTILGSNRGRGFAPADTLLESTGQYGFRNSFFRVETRDVGGASHPDLVVSTPSLLLWRQGESSGFGAQQPLFRPAGDEMFDARFADFNGDDTLGVATIEAVEDTRVVRVYVNRDTSGQQPVEVARGQIEFLRVVDANGDGAPDLAAVHRQSDPFADDVNLYENTLSSTSTFGARKDVATLERGVTAFRVADLNGNGHRDLIVQIYRDTKQIPGTENGFGEPKSIASTGYNSTLVQVSDLQGDGRKDLLYRAGSAIKWFLQQASGDFGPAQSLDAQPMEETVQAGDLDGDGDQDFFWGNRQEYDSPISWQWVENDNGTFSTPRTLTSVAADRWKTNLADLDRDGDLDLLTTKQEYGTTTVVGYDNTDLPPQPPATLRAQTLDRTVRLRWTPSGDWDLDHYRIYRGTSPNPSTVIDTVATSTQSYVDTDVQNGQSYHYRIAAVDEAGTEGDPSSEVRVIPAVPVTELTPTSGTPGTEVRLFGGGFPTDTSASTVTFGETEVSIVKATDSRLTVEVPEGPVGPVPVTVETRGGRDTTARRFVVQVEAQRGELKAGSTLSGSGDRHTATWLRDVDRDGNTDLLSIRPGEGEVIWYEHTDGFLLSSPTVLGTVSGSFTNSEAADVDGDGDVDIVAWKHDGYYDPTELVWFENESGTFTTPHVVATDSSEGGGGADIAVADFDGDGAADILSRGTDGGMVWYRQTGFGTFAADSIDATDTRWLQTADVDGDGDHDILTRERHPLRVHVYDNQIDEGNGFVLRETVTREEDIVGNAHISVGDLNQDGFPDLSVGNIWYPNDGGTFETSRRLPNVFDDQVPQPPSHPGGYNDQLLLAPARIADMDADGRNDLLLPIRQNVDNAPIRLGWFTEKQRGEWTRRVDFANMTSFDGWTHGDVDDDGDIDILARRDDGTIVPYLNGNYAPEPPKDVRAVGMAGTARLDWDRPPADDLAHYRVYRKEQGGTETRMATVSVPTTQWTDSTVTNGTSYRYRVTAVDSTNLESDFSIARTATPAVSVTAIRPLSGQSGDPIRLYGAGFDASSSGNTVTMNGSAAPVADASSSMLSVPIPEGLYGPAEVQVETEGASQSMPGAVTVVGPTSHGDFEEQSSRSLRRGGEYKTLRFADVDGDGDRDLITSRAGEYYYNADQMIWLENTDSTRFQTTHVIADEQGDKAIPRMVDFDLDGDVDLLSVRSGAQSVWYENDGTGQFGDATSLSDTVNIPHRVRPADLDGDGDHDLVGVGGAGRLGWYEHVGVRSFASFQPIGTRTASPTSVAVSDFDTDGDPDLVAGYDGDAVHFENQLSSDGSWTSSTLDSKDDSPKDLQSVDLNDDGRPDLLMRLDGRVAWMQKQDRGFRAPTMLTEELYNLHSLTAGDLTGSGMPDLVFAWEEEDSKRVSWLRNQDGGQFGARIPIGTGTDRQRLALEDLNGDGALDIVQGQFAGYSPRVSWWKNTNLRPAPVSELSTTVDSTSALLSWGESPSWDVVGYELYRGSTPDALTEVDSVGGDVTQIRDSGLTAGATYHYRLVTIDSEGATSAGVTTTVQVGTPSLSVTRVTPHHGVPGTSVEIFGAAFDEGSPTVTFGTAEATVVDRSATNLTVTVPSEARRGPVPLRVSRGDQTVGSAAPFTVLQSSGTFTAPRSLTDQPAGYTELYPAFVDDSLRSTSSSKSSGLVDFLAIQHDTESPRAELVWYRNRLQSTNKYEGPMRIGAESERTRRPVVGDLDGDQDPDVVLSQYGDNTGGDTSTVYWYENQGDRSFTRHVIDSTAQTVWRPTLADWDADGDQDVLVGFGHLDESQFVWYENYDGEGHFAAAQPVSSRLDGSPNLTTTDVDGDGDVDLVGGRKNGLLALFLNDGTGHVADIENIHRSDRYGNLKAGDLTGNGRPDLVRTTVSRSAGGRVWMARNTGGSAALFSDWTKLYERGDTGYYDEVFEDVELRDLDGDGDLDLVVLITSSAGDATHRVAWGENRDDASGFKALQDLETGPFLGPLAVMDVDANGTLDVVMGRGDYRSGQLIARFGKKYALPVELADFDATVDDGAVDLSWTTASETGNAGFRVQRKTGVKPSRREGSTMSSGEGGETWTTVGRVEGSGTTTEAQSYRFTDADLPYEADSLAYRLTQVDTDGSVHVSEAITVERGVEEVQLLGTAPNPAQSRATVRYALPEKQEVEMRLYDVLGRQVRTVVHGRKEGRHEQTLDVSGLSSGVYFLRLQAGGEVRTQKLTVVR